MSVWFVLRCLNWSVQRWWGCSRRADHWVSLGNTRPCGSDHWTAQMTCQCGMSSVKTCCLVPLLVCLASHISAVHAPRAMYVMRAVSRSRLREILTHLRASGRCYQYVGDSWNFRETWDVCKCLLQRSFEQAVTITSAADINIQTIVKQYLLAR